MIHDREKGREWRGHSYRSKGAPWLRRQSASADGHSAEACLACPGPPGSPGAGSQVEQTAPSACESACTGATTNQQSVNTTQQNFS